MNYRMLEAVERERESYNLNNIEYIKIKKGNIGLSGKYYDTG